jgi:REP element-mobilizing transposase RayT
MPSGRIRSRGRLPHLESENGIYFITFRLGDSLPQSVLTSLQITYSRDPDAARKRVRDVESVLERGHGACYLKRPAIAQVVAETLQKFDGERYRLFAWCIMPNHVHVVCQPLLSFDLDDILQSWKSYTAQQANGILNRKGKVFWQREYFDHLIRDDGQFDRAIRYTVENPIKAGLKDWRWVYVAPDLT